MKLRRREKAALWVVGILATWVNLAANLVVWELLYVVRHAIGLHLDLINYELSVWPVLIDIVILMSTVIWTRQQMHGADLQAQSLRNQEDMMRAMLAIAESIHAQVEDIGEDMDDMREEENDA